MYFRTGYTCKLLYLFRKVQYKPSFFNRYKYRKLQEKHGNEIPRQVTIGEGLYLGHIGPRYINAGVVIGKNAILIKMLQLVCQTEKNMRCFQVD